MAAVAGSYFVCNTGKGAPVRAITTVGFAKSTPAIVAPPFKKSVFWKIGIIRVIAVVENYFATVLQLTFNLGWEELPEENGFGKMFKAPSR